MVCMAGMASVPAAAGGLLLCTQSHLPALPHGTFETDTPLNFLCSLNQSFFTTSFCLIYIWAPGTPQNPVILGVMGSRWPSPVLGRRGNLPHPVLDLRVGDGLSVEL